jgi:hypothetical protein
MKDMAAWPFCYMNGITFNVDKFDFIQTSDTPSPSPSPTPVPTPSPVPPAVPQLHTDESPTPTPGSSAFPGDSKSNPLMITQPNTNTEVDLSHGYCWVGFPQNNGGMQLNHAGNRFDVVIEYNGSSKSSGGLKWSWGPGISGISIMKVTKTSGYDSLKLTWW